MTGRRRVFRRIARVHVLALALAGCGARGRVPREQAAVRTPPADARGPEVERVAAIRSLPYVNYVPVAPGDRGKRGVTLEARSRADRAYVLYVPKPRYEALLVDAKGAVVHRWASGAGRLSRAEAARWPDFLDGWQAVTMAPNGDLFAVLGRHAVLKLDWNSRLVWTRAIPAHHDVAIAENGDLYVPTEGVRVVESGGRTRVVLDDGIAILRPDGSVRRRVSLFDAFARSDGWAAALERRIGERFRALDERGLEGLVPPGGASGAWGLDREGAARAARLLSSGRVEGDAREAVATLRAIPGAPSDLFHVNTVVPLGRDVRGLWEDGDVLVSLRSWNLVAVIDMTHERIGWSWGPGEIEGAHQPTVLSNGNILVFDNGESRGRSRVVEVDPGSKRITWSYEAPGFFSASEGGCEELPSGNVLVTESGTGRVFEVTREKRTVWEFFNPHFDAAGVRRSGIYRPHAVSPGTAARLLAKR